MEVLKELLPCTTSWKIWWAIFRRKEKRNDPDMFVRDDESVLLNGDAPVQILTDVIEDFEIDFNEIDYSTVAGFVLSKMNEIPKVGDKFVFQQHSFEVVDMDGNRIDKLLITKL